MASPGFTYATRCLLRSPSTPMSYLERQPDQSLSSTIQRFWMICPRKNGCQETVIPDGCSDIVFCFHRESHEIVDWQCYLPHITPLTVLLGSSPLSWFGISFYPGMLPHMEDHHVLWERLSLYLNGSNDFWHMTMRCERFFLAMIPPLDSKPQWNGFLHTIFKHRGAIGMSTLAKLQGISTRHMARWCRQQSGLGPKQLVRIVRLQNTMARLVSRPGAPGLDIILGNGYFDTAHFHHECHALTGLSPSTLVRDIAQPFEQDP